MNKNVKALLVLLVIAFIVFIGIKVYYYSQNKSGQQAEYVLQQQNSAPVNRVVSVPVKKTEVKTQIQFKDIPPPVINGKAWSEVEIKASDKDGASHISYGGDKSMFLSGRTWSVSFDNLSFEQVNIIDDQIHNYLESVGYPSTFNIPHYLPELNISVFLPAADGDGSGSLGGLVWENDKLRLVTKYRSIGGPNELNDFMCPCSLYYEVFISDPFDPLSLLK